MEGFSVIVEGSRGFWVKYTTQRNWGWGRCLTYVTEICG